MGSFTECSESPSVWPCSSRARPSLRRRPSPGSLQQGAKLTATAGTWAGSGTITYAYQWYRCDANGAHCGSIHGATRGTYTQVRKDVGQTIGLTVRATDTTGTTAAYAPLAGLVAAPGATPVATKQPPESGEPIVGARTEGRGGDVELDAGRAHATAGCRCNANGRLCTVVAGATTDTYSRHRRRRRPRAARRGDGREADGAQPQRRRRAGGARPASRTGGRPSRARCSRAAA